MKNSLLTTTLFYITFLLFTISCNDHTNNEAFGTSILDTMSNEKIGSSTRAFTEEGGENENPVRFTVIYNGDLTQMTTDENSNFKILLETYALEIENPFEIDEQNKGFVLVPTTPLDEPIEVGREISLLDEVLMVEVDNVKKEEKDPS